MDDFEIPEIPDYLKIETPIPDSPEPQNSPAPYYANPRVEKAQDYTLEYTRRMGVLLEKYSKYLLLADVYLSHAPNRQRFALCDRILSTSYDLADIINEASAKSSIKQLLNLANGTHRKLRYQWYIFYKLGFFKYRNQKSEFNETDALLRFANINDHLDEIGRLIGGWIKKYNNRQAKFPQTPDPQELEEDYNKSAL